MFNDPNFLKRFKLVQALSEVFQGDGEISDLITEAGFTATERACELAAQSVIVTFEAHALGKLSAPVPAAANGHTRRPAKTRKTPKDSKAMANCPHCGNEFNTRGLTKHANACKENPANS